MNRILTHPTVNRLLRRVVRPFASVISRRVLWHLPVVGVVEIRPEGESPAALMGNDGNDRVASMIYWLGAGGWEPGTVRLFLRFVAPGSTVIDVGANSGLFALLAARKHPTVAVHAAEPVGRVFSRLQSNVVLNRLPNVTCHRVALHDVDGPAVLHVPTKERVPMMASLVPDWCPDSQSEAEAVDCVTLDALVAGSGAGPVSVIKIDAEGAEDAVLRGAAATLDRDRPFVFCELLVRTRQAAAVSAALGEKGYRPFTVGFDGARPCPEVRGGTDDDENHNFLFVHETRLDELQAAPLG